MTPQHLLDRVRELLAQARAVAACAIAMLESL